MRIITILSASVLLFATSLANAGSDSGFYIGGSVGNSKIDYSENDPDFGDLEIDDSDSAFKVFGGYNFGLVPFLNIAAEGAYYDFGSHEEDIISIDTSAWAAFGVVGFDLGPIGLFGKAGVFRWDSDTDFENIGDDSDSGSDPAYGIGAKFQLGSFAVRAEYEVFDLDGIDIDFFSVGGSITF